MQNGKPYILFCAGEDSGDCLGEELVKQALLYSRLREEPFDVVGSGGLRMRNAGLLPLVDFETLPVSGFGDVLPKYWQLRKSYKILEDAIKSDLCKGLVSIDYPGFNMKLVALAKKLNKPVLYVAPPQIWAWKSFRAKLFAGNDNITLAVFFDFEAEAYRRANCNVVKINHPFAVAVSRVIAKSAPSPVEIRKRILLLPGSRKSQALRNIPVFLEIVKSLGESFLQDKEIVLLAARDSLVSPFEMALTKFNSVAKSNLNITVSTSPESAEKRMEWFQSSLFAIAAPGTATLELALSSCPTVVCTKPDFLTLFLAKRSVRTRLFALPNIILRKEMFPEYISAKFDSPTITAAAEAVKKMTEVTPSFSKDLLKNLQADYNSEKLMSEFLAKLF